MALRGSVRETADGDVIVYDERGNEILTIDMSASGRAVRVASGAVLDADVNVSALSLADGSLARAKLATESKFFNVPTSDVLGADGAALAVSETAGDFFRQIGTNQLYIQGEASISETEVSVGWFEYVLPSEYVAGGTITLRAVVDVTGSGTLGTCTIDFEARLQTDATGAVGSDLVTTAATAITATGAAKDFTITPTGLVAGDRLICKMTTSVEETAGSAIQALITKLGFVLQVKG